MDTAPLFPTARETAGRNCCTDSRTAVHRAKRIRAASECLDMPVRRSRGSKTIPFPTALAESRRTTLRQERFRTAADAANVLRIRRAQNSSRRFKRRRNAEPNYLQKRGAEFAPHASSFFVLSELRPRARFNTPARKLSSEILPH